MPYNLQVYDHRIQDNRKTIKVELEETGLSVYLNDRLIIDASKITDSGIFRVYKETCAYDSDHKCYRFDAE